MIKVTYTKHFLTGTLKGLDVKCGYTVANPQSAIDAQKWLNSYTPENPGSDCLTGARFWVHGIGSEEVRAA